MIQRVRHLFSLRIMNFSIFITIFAIASARAEGINNKCKIDAVNAASSVNDGQSQARFWHPPHTLLDLVFPEGANTAKQVTSSQRRSRALANRLPAVLVKDVEGLVSALDAANQNRGPKKILLKPGLYKLKHRLKVERDGIALMGESGNPLDTVLSGMGMRPTKGVDNLLWVNGKDFMLDGLALQHVGNHLIQIVGEQDADGAIIQNCILRDGYEQLLKVSWAGHDKPTGDKGIIENCVFEYSAGVGPNYYIGGIDIHGGADWLIKNNLFKNIASPEGHIAEHAIHFWSNSKNPIIERNVIINSDRGIGLGLGERGNVGGVIRNNIMLHEKNNHPYADVGIVLENSSDTLIENNIVFHAHRYYNAIEYRFEGSKNVVIKNNRTNKRISARNGGKAMLEENQQIRSVGEVLPSAFLEKLDLKL